MDLIIALCFAVLIILAALIITAAIISYPISLECDNLKTQQLLYGNLTEDQKLHVINQCKGY